jgi:hypothetical protein
MMQPKNKLCCNLQVENNLTDVFLQVQGDLSSRPLTQSAN